MNLVDNGADMNPQFSLNLCPAGPFEECTVGKDIGGFLLGGRKALLFSDCDKVSKRKIANIIIY